MLLALVLLHYCYSIPGLMMTDWPYSWTVDSIEGQWLLWPGHWTVWPVGQFWLFIIVPVEASWGLVCRDSYLLLPGRTYPGLTWRTRTPGRWEAQPSPRPRKDLKRTDCWTAWLTPDSRTVGRTRTDLTQPDLIDLTQLLARHWTTVNWLSLDIVSEGSGRTQWTLWHDPRMTDGLDSTDPDRPDGPVGQIGQLLWTDGHSPPPTQLMTLLCGHVVIVLLIIEVIIDWHYCVTLTDRYYYYYYYSYYRLRQPADLVGRTRQ